jgi:hypothetical protein
MRVSPHSDPVVSERANDPVRICVYGLEHGPFQFGWEFETNGFPYESGNRDRIEYLGLVIRQATLPAQSTASHPKGSIGHASHFNDGGMGSRFVALPAGFWGVAVWHGGIVR